MKDKEMIINSLHNIESYLKAVKDDKLDKEHIKIWASIKLDEVHSVIKLLKEEK